MAEARNAVAFSAATKLHSVYFESHEEGLTIHIPKSLYTPRLLARSVAKMLHRFKNLLLTMFWPAPPLAVLAVIVLFVAFVSRQPVTSWWRSGSVANLLWSSDSMMLVMLCPPTLCAVLPSEIRVGYLAALAAFLFILLLMVLQRIFLRFLLHYRNWMYERRPSILTLIWGGTLKAIYLAGRHPMTYSFQRALPRQNVPSVSTTVDTYLKSVVHVLPERDLEDMRSMAKTFLSSSATKLNLVLSLKSWWSTNYVTDWWLKYVYLRQRTPIFISSNFYGIGHGWWQPTKIQAARAAVLTAHALDFFRQLDRETLDPLLIRGTVPLCMSQYKYLFSTCRLPGKECDSLRHYDSSESRHIAVCCDGVWYAVDVIVQHPDGRIAPITAPQLQLVFQAILDVPSEDPGALDTQMAALTTMERTKWASIREDHFSFGLNKASLEEIERAIFVVNLDRSSPTTFTEQGRLLFMGDGRNRWCDKSVSFVVFANGKSGLHAEHSWGDAPVAAHCMEVMMVHETPKFGAYDDSGNAKGYVELAAAMGSKTGSGAGAGAGSSDAAAPQLVTKPRRLRWALTDPLETIVASAMSGATAAMDDLDLVVTEYNAFGKGFMKKHGVSPDGFIQMALQLAYYRDAGKFVQTYESAMTRLFRDGRTETIRSCSDESVAFVLAMQDGKLSNEDLVALLRAATVKHQKTSRDAMNGYGVDRHLFALYVTSLGLGQEVPFLKAALSTKWHLSTSQLPQRQTSIRVPLPDGAPPYQYGSPSGGFGPVSDEGYGVSYMVVSDLNTVFHVSSKNSSDATSSQRFVDRLHQAFADMKALFPEKPAKK